MVLSARFLSTVRLAIFPATNRAGGDFLNRNIDRQLASSSVTHFGASDLKLGRLISNEINGTGRLKLRKL
jgi:hypothetical protein